MNNSIMEQLIDDKKNCCGCGLCSVVCPKGAIDMEQDIEGFFYPRINSAKCIECRQCVKVCIVGRKQR